MLSKADRRRCFPSVQDVLSRFLQHAWAGQPCLILVRPSSTSPEMDSYIRAVEHLYGNRSELFSLPFLIFPCATIKEAKAIAGPAVWSFFFLWNGKVLSDK